MRHEGDHKKIPISVVLGIEGSNYLKSNNKLQKFAALKSKIK